MSSLSYGVGSWLYGVWAVSYMGSPQDYTFISWDWGYLSIHIFHSQSPYPVPSPVQVRKWAVWVMRWAVGYMVWVVGWAVGYMVVACEIIMSSPGTGFPSYPQSQSQSLDNFSFLKEIIQGGGPDELYSQKYDNICVMFASIPNYKEFYTENDINKQGLECIRLLNEIICDFDKVRRILK